MSQDSSRIFFTACSVIQLITLTSAVVAVSAGSAESDLIRQLLQDYNPAVRPVLNPGDAINVTVSLGLKTFIELDMRSQTAVSFGWLKIVWTDQLLTWDPAEHGNVTALHVPKEKVWCPDLVIFNTLTDINALNEQPTKVAIQHDGRMLWYPGGLFQTYCTVDITYYPFDTQLCSIDIITWSLPAQFLNGTFGDPVFDVLDILENHPAWDLMHTDSEYVLRPAGFWVLTFKLVIKRKTLFYVINIILPMTLLSSLSSLVFLLPAQSGEKMTVCVTSFLSLAVFVSFINETLPQNSDSLCFFSVYIIVQMLMSLCSTALCAFTVSLVHREREEQSVNTKTSKPHAMSDSQSRHQPSSSNRIPSLSSQLTFPFTTQTSYSRQRTTACIPDTNHNVEHISPQDATGLADDNSQRAGMSARHSHSAFLLPEFSRKPWNLEWSLPNGSKQGLLSVGGGCGGEVLTTGKQTRKYSHRGNGVPALVAERVDKLCLAIMLSANVVSCFVYTLSMTQ